MSFETGKRESLKIEGFIEVELINKKNNTKRVYKNTITKGGKQLLLAKSAGILEAIAADTFGSVDCSNALNKNMCSVPAIEAKICYSSRVLTNMLLNLPDDVLTGLGETTSFINVLDTDMNLADKVLGYANNNLIASDVKKEGIIDTCKAQYVVDPYTTCRRWKYAEGVATGNINVIAMMPAGVLNNYGDGVKFSKCIDKVNVQSSNYVSMSTGFLIPGVPGYTGNSEVLLNFNMDGNSRWKYNIGTGEISAVSESDNFFIPEPTSGEITDMQYIDNYLYVVSVVIGSKGSQRVYIDIYDPLNSMNKVKSFTAQYKISAEYKIKAIIFKGADGNVYVSAVNSTSTTTSGAAKLWKITKTGTEVPTSIGTAETDFSSIGLSLPTGLDVTKVGIGKYGDNYILYNPIKYLDNLGRGTFVESNYIGYKMVGYVFSDLSDPAGSLIDMIPGITPNEVLFNIGGTAGSLRIGFDSDISDIGRVNDIYDFGNNQRIIQNNTDKTNEGNITYNTMKTGVFLTLNKWWTNVISFVKLTTPIQKAENDILYVSYGYKIV